MTTASQAEQAARPGDWIEVHGLRGEPARRGQILHVLGAGRQVHYRVRWAEHQESIFFPADATVVITRPHGADG
jgi:hypothetical protein